MNSIMTKILLFCIVLSTGIQQYALGPVHAFQIIQSTRTRTTVNTIISSASFTRRSPVLLFAGRPGFGGSNSGGGGGNRRYQPKVEAKDANRPVMNNEIPASELRVVASSSNGKDIALGVMSKDEALAKALEMGGLDVILINANSDPPVVKIVDYSKYRYTLEKKAKEVKKNSKASELKEIKMSYKIDIHDYDVRKKSALKFIQQGNRVKCTVMFRGREMQHDKLGYELLDKLAAELDTVCIQEGRPKREGRNLSLMLSPKVEVLRAVNEARKAAKKSRNKVTTTTNAIDEDDDDEDDEDDDDDDEDDDDDDDDYDDNGEVNGQKPIAVASGGKVPKREKTLEEILGTDEYL